MERLMRLFQILIDDFLPPTCIFFFLIAPEFLRVTLSSYLQKDVRLARRNSSGNPTRNHAWAGAVSYQAWGMGKGAWERGHEQISATFSLTSVPMVQLSIGERCKAWLPGTKKLTFFPPPSLSACSRNRMLVDSCPFCVLSLCQNGHDDRNTVMFY